MPAVPPDGGYHNSTSGIEPARDYIAEIEEAGAQLVQFADRRGYPAVGRKVSTSVGKTTSTLNDHKGKKEENYETVAGATASTVQSAADAVDKLSSGDPAQVAIGVLDILTEMTSLCALAGPEGAIVGMVLGSVFSVIGGIIGIFSRGDEEEEEPLEDMLKRVITEALNTQTAADLKSTAAGVTDEMCRRMSTIVRCCLCEEISVPTLTHISADGYLYCGVEFLGKLEFYIKEQCEETTTPQSVAVLLASYVKISAIRIQMLMMVASLYGGNDAGVLCESAIAQANAQQQSVKETLSFLTREPEEKTYKIYGMVFGLPMTDRNIIDKVIGGISCRLAYVAATGNWGKLMDGRDINTCQNDIRSVKFGNQTAPPDDAYLSEQFQKEDGKFYYMHFIYPVTDLASKSGEWYMIRCAESGGFIWSCGTENYDLRIKRAFGEHHHNSFWQFVKKNSSEVYITCHADGKSINVDDHADPKVRNNRNGCSRFQIKYI